MRITRQIIKLFFVIAVIVIFSSFFRVNIIDDIIVRPEIKRVESISMIFAGDIMLDRGVRASVVKYMNGDYAKLFENLKLLKDFNIAFANLEGPVSDQGRDKHNLYSFRMDPATLPVLKNAGISIVSVANNHVGDWGRAAYIDTLARLKQNNLLFAGGGLNKAQAETPTIIVKNGMKLGFLGFSDVGPNDMAAGTDQAGLLLASDKNFDEIIRNASTQVDYLIVSFHFGEEYKPIHNQRQEYLAHRAADDGAKIVIGSHPHVVEDFETYKNSFIAYSLGNFIFDQSWSEPTMESMMLEIKLSKDGSMTTTKDTFKLNNFFQPSDITKGQEEKVEFVK